jgi:hypothetical protein
LYEIGSPRYLGPDVTARFDSIQLAQVDTDLVSVSTVTGEPPPPDLKVAMNYVGGYRSDFTIALTGLDIEAKADLVERAFWQAVPVEPQEIAKVSTDLIRTDHTDPTSNLAATAQLRISLKDGDPAKIGRPLAGALNELALATIPGFYALGSPNVAAPFGVYWPATCPAELVPATVTILGGESHLVSSVASAADPTAAEPTAAEPKAAEPTAAEDPSPNPPQPSTPSRWASESRVSIPLGQLFGARSGDKGGNANLGIFARSAEAYAWLESALSTDMIRLLLPETADLAIHRYELANLWSLNFVFEGLLQDGVAASTRPDAQAKSLGEWLRARLIDVPASLVGPSG